MCVIYYTDPVFYYTHLIFGIFSLLGSFAIILCYFSSYKRKVLSFYLIFNLAIAQFFVTLEFILPISLDSQMVVCKTLAVITNSCQLVSLVWITYIAVNIYQVVTGNVFFFDKHKVFWTLVAWVGVPLVNCIPLITGSYNRIGRTCSFSMDFVGDMERLILFYIPSWIMLLLTIACYIQIFMKINRFELEATYKRILIRLSMYPLILGINIMLFTFLRLSYYLFEPCTTVLIEFISYTIIALNGFFNFLIFISTPGNSALMKLKKSNKEILLEDYSDEFSLNN